MRTNSEKIFFFCLHNNFQGHFQLQIQQMSNTWKRVVKNQHRSNPKPQGKCRTASPQAKVGSNWKPGAAAVSLTAVTQLKWESLSLLFQADRVSPAKMRVFMSPKSARQDTGSERRSPFSPCELRITESGNQNSHSVKAAPALAARAEEQRAASETHI